MSTADGNPTIQELQRHARWIRSLAGALLRDETAAEDLVQETWVAALTHPPGAGRLRPWLRKVAHNFAGQHQRGTARRAAREQEACPPSGPEAPDAYAERLEAEQRLTRELAALAEPFRSTLMLRYYEDLEPAEIAARLGLPGGTVRWRLMRGLALLRERLDQAHGGERRAWSLALLPLARLDGPAGIGASGIGAAATAVVWPGIVAMNVLKLSVSAAALLVLALGVSLSGLLPEALTLRVREAALEVDFRPLLDEAVPARSEAPPSSAAAVARIALEGGSEPEATPAVATDVATVDARVSGRGRTLGDARLVVVHAGERHESASASSGLVQCSFALADARAAVRVELHALGFASQLREAVCEAGGTTHLGRIELAPGGAVSGRLVDEHGLALAGGRVTLGSLDEPYPQLEAARLDPAPDVIPACTSEADGRFRLLGVPAGMVRLWAHADGRKAAYSPPLEVRAGQESLGVELALEPLAPGNLLRGIVLDPAGAPVPGAEIEYRHTLGGNVRGGDTKADGHGRFEFLLPEDTRSWLRATDPAGRFGAGSLSDVANGEREVVLQLREAREVELLVRGRSGTPLESFAVDLRAVATADVEELAEEMGTERATELVARYSTRLGGLARAPHEGGRARVALPDQPFVLRVLAPAHRVFQLGPLEPARVGATLECTLEPVPGLAGVVLRGAAPAAGVRVVLCTEVEADTVVEVNGYRVRMHPDAHDETRTGADGRFLLTARAPGSYFVRAEPDTGAPAEVGPLVVGAALGGAPLELHLGSGGAIEGRVRLEGGADPEGAIVGITRGDGGERTRRVASDGRFRFEALLPGPWRVELRKEELFGTDRQVSSTQGPAVTPFELAANCTVYEGETTFVDVSDAAPGSVSFEGRLLVDERPALGWTAKLGPAGLLDFEDGPWTALDGEGHFVLRAPGPGDYRLTLRMPGGEFQEQYLFDDVVVRGGDAPWERALHTGKLRLTGVGQWKGDGPPRAVHFWRGPGQFFGVTVQIGDDARALDVPAGPAELRAPSASMDPATWRVLRRIEVRRGEELAVELSAAELDAR